MSELRPDSAIDKLMQLVINVGGFGLMVGVIALIVAVIVHEAG